MSRPNSRRALRAMAGLACCGIAVAGCAGTSSSAGGHSSDAADQTTVAPAAPAALRVVSISPAASPGGTVSPASVITVRLSSAVAHESVHPSIAPAVSGHWSQTSPTTFRFTPAVSLPLGAKLTVTVPGGGLGVLASDGAQLRSSVTRTLHTRAGSTLRLQQLLAQLGYLPLAFHPATGVAHTYAAQLAAAVSPPAGTFTWRWSAPATLTYLWGQGSANTITTGAVMAFEFQHGLAVDGVAGPEVWNALLKAAVAGQRDPAAYSYVLVTKSLPERATVYENGRVVFSTLANTGIPASPTADGTWPVYARFTSTTMTGTNPDGTHYNDHGVPWVSYFHGGDALHGFLRASYGFAQSLGCVEMPYSSADVVWHDVSYGTLVTVTG